MTILTHIDHQYTQPTAVLHIEFQYGSFHGYVLSLFFVLFVLFIIMVVVVVVFVVPILPSSFISAPSSVAAKGGDVRNQFDGGGRYVPYPSLLQRV